MHFSESCKENQRGILGYLRVNSLLTNIKSRFTILSRYIEIVSLKGDNVRSSRRAWRESRFERGDIKYVILDLLREKPSYGYEIIRALEERFGGLYTPSAGTIYPTLQMLEEMGYVTSSQSEGRKIHTITPAGIQFLEDQKNQVADVRERMRGMWDRKANSEDVHDMVDRLRDMLKTVKHNRRHITPDKLRQVREVLERAQREIEDLLRD
jgi:DNA-binding PadR family transcriptional regulator